ncbi:hypothetical protein [Chenggangzhangella methanolivorans]|uniref:Uncharacterized protein n=1 Tax=Chenggangzhangella methanolivorans TaxID=1437009 RepID=A0A9E6REK0_9HYPH|nr:hypothetical protein [Chenggangzhangella methanolivorans]QZN99765.1 hypothetical protein K6K41_24375 [Chenggangzhangella methanolivorans]
MIKPGWGAGRTIFASLFMAWGFIGFAWLMAETWLRLISTTSAGVGVGTSSFIAALALVWIGGMVLFGVGALMFVAPSDMVEIGGHQQPPRAITANGLARRGRSPPGERGTRSPYERRLRHQIIRLRIF